MHGSEAKWRSLSRRRSLHIFLVAPCCADGLKVGQKLAVESTECSITPIVWSTVWPWQTSPLIRGTSKKITSFPTGHNSEHGCLQLAQDQTTHAIAAKEAVDGNCSSRRGFVAQALDTGALQIVSEDPGTVLVLVDLEMGPCETHFAKVGERIGHE
jgi:hypothetical protein